MDIYSFFIDGDVSRVGLSPTAGVEILNNTAFCVHRFVGVAAENAVHVPLLRVRESAGSYLV
jgi:hypothetical protein